MLGRDLGRLIFATVAFGLAAACGTTPTAAPAATVPAANVSRRAPDVAAAPTPSSEAVSAPARGPGALDACGCPKKLEPTGVRLWRQRLDPALTECLASFRGPSELELECSGAERSQDKRLRFDIGGQKVEGAPPDVSKNALLERALADKKTWGKPGIAEFGPSGYIALNDGGVLWALTTEGDDSQVVRIDAHARQLWSRRVPGLVVSGLSDSQGGIVVAGMVAACEVPGQPGAFQNQGIVTRLSAKGDAIGSLRQPCATVVTALLQPTASELAVMGVTQPFGDAAHWYPQHFVAMASLDGQPLFTRTADGVLTRACSCTLEVNTQRAEGGPLFVELVAWP